MVGILILSASCQSLSPQTKPQPKYQLLLDGTVDGQPFIGTAVGSQASSHQMMIHSQIPVNYFTVQSCHRSLQFVDVIQANWYDWSADSKSFKWTYQMAPGLEDTGDCPLRFCAFSKTPGSPPVACAVVDFKAAKYTQVARNICNGSNTTVAGTFICHTQVGLLERVQFLETMEIAPKPTITNNIGSATNSWITNQCDGKWVDDQQTIFEYALPETECYSIFMQHSQPHRRAKLTAIPFDSPMYGGGN